MPEPCSTRQVLQPAAQLASDPPLEAACSKEALRKRLERMLLGEGERPRASSFGKAFETANISVMATIREAAGDLWRDREADIKAAVAPWRGLIDEIDTIAYLAADAHGQPLLHPDDTNRLGKRVASQATRAAAAIAAAEKTAVDAVRRASVAAAADPSKLPKVKAAEAKGATDVAAVRDKPTPAIEWPARTVGKRKRETASTPQPVQPPAPPPPPHPPTDAAFHDAVRAAVDAELARRACAEAEAARQQTAAAEAARLEEAKATLVAARIELPRAERSLRLAKQARAQLGPEPEYAPPAPPGVSWRPPSRLPGCSDEERRALVYQAALAAGEEWQQRCTAASQALREKKQPWRDADKCVVRAQWAVDDAREDLAEAESAVQRRGRGVDSRAGGVGSA